MVWTTTPACDVDVPAFRFVFQPTTWRLLVYPRGFGDDTATLGLPRSWSGATGDIYALGPREALAVFGSTRHDLRPIVELALEQWARSDRWCLWLSALETQLVPPAPTGPKPWLATCHACRGQVTSHLSPENVFAKRNWVSSICPICEGRLAWTTGESTEI